MCSRVQVVDRSAQELFTLSPATEKKAGGLRALDYGQPLVVKSGQYFVLTWLTFIPFTFFYSGGLT